MATAHAPAKVAPGLVGAAIRGDNLLLAKLPNPERLALIARCEVVELAFDRVLCEQHASLSHVYFPLTGFISQVLTLEGHSLRVEMGLVGMEGMLGSSLLVGVKLAPGQARVHGAGFALRLEVAEFALVLENSPTLARTLDRYVYVVASQFAQIAACHRLHPVPARLARWLLMARGRAQSDDSCLTHEIAAYSLGLCRERVTQAAELLQDRQLIRSHCGRVSIVNARALEASTCECYGMMARMYAEIMGCALARTP
jgi:CRP-like cAMP-binding protein